METTLHRQLKECYCEPGAQIEYKLGRYRIDVVNGDRLMEIQRSGLSSIRDKINNLLAQGYTVDVVKPLVSRKRLVKLSRKNGKEIDRRWSPLRESMLSVFDELIYFTRVFPHPNLTLITPLIQIEEIRYPGQGRRRRRREAAFVVKDRMILEIESEQRYQTVLDLHSLLPRDLPEEFDTQELAAVLQVPRHEAQRIAYVMRKTGAAIETGKRGNAITCRLATARESKQALRAKRVGGQPKRVLSANPARAKSAEKSQAKASSKQCTKPKRATTTQPPTIEESPTNDKSPMKSGVRKPKSVANRSPAAKTKPTARANTKRNAHAGKASASKPAPQRTKINKKSVTKTPQVAAAHSRSKRSRSQSTALKRSA